MPQRGAGDLLERSLEPSPQVVDGRGTTDAQRAALRAFRDVAEALGQVPDLDALLHLIATRISELASARRCSIYLRDAETGTFRGQIGHPEEVRDDEIKRLVAGVPADRFTREIAETKRPVALSNALDDPRPIRATMRAWNIRSILGVPMVLRGEVIGIIFVDDKDRPHDFSAADCELAATFADLAAVAIAQVRLTGELRASLTTIARQNQLLRRAAAMDDRLANLGLEGGDLREIAYAVAELTGKPTSIHDARDRPLARAVPPSADGAVVPRLLDPPHRSHRAVVEALAGLDPQRGGVVGPLPAAGLPQRFLVVPVTMRAQVCGHLVVMEYGRRFGALDPHIARRAATNVALELAAERRAAAAEWDARASLTADLVRGNRDTGALDRRARYLGVDLGAPRVLCLITSGATDEGRGPSSSDVALALRDGAADDAVLAAGVAEGVGALLELPPEAPTMDGIAAVRGRVVAALDRLGAGLAAAISTRCTAPADYVRAYDEARQVMRCLRTLSGERGLRLLTADDLGAGRLVLASTQREEAERFARDTLGGLLAGDEHTRDLLGTLQAFFDAARSVRRSAVVLGVHENTIRYRLTRIEELTGLAVSSCSQDQLSAQLALLVLRLQGVLPLTPETPALLPA